MKNRPFLPIGLQELQVISIPITIGGWGLQNPGSDPFGGPTRIELVVPFGQSVEAEITFRKQIIEKNLRGLADLNERMVERATRMGLPFPETYRIRGISIHDADLWPDEATDEQIEEMVRWLLKLLDELGLEVECFTTNLFSHPAFRSGAFTSPFGGVRDAALTKSLRGVRAAIILRAKNIIFWGGREGTEFYEQDATVALHRFMVYLKIIIDWAISQGYKGTFTIEPKQWEPRFQLFGGNEGVFMALIVQYFSEERYRGRVGVNPELPQHVAMSGLSPVLAAANCLVLECMISIIHYGGQIAGRMDSDFAPGLGGNIFEDFHTLLLLHKHADRWGKVLELDCHPARTTTTFEGAMRFLMWSVFYIRMIEDKIRQYAADPVILKIEAEHCASVSRAEKLLNEASCVHQTHESIAQYILDNPQPLAVATMIPTDSIEAHAYRTIQILSGEAERGLFVFEGSPWAP